MEKARDHAKRKVADSFSGQYTEEEVRKPVHERSSRKRAIRRPTNRARFSSTEKRDLVIASILVVLVGISMMGYPRGVFYAIPQLIYFVSAGFWWFPTITIGIFLVSFMAHEMAHKFVAQHYGQWSEFRMTRQGYLLSALAILTSFPIFGTGVVATSRAKSLEEDAKVNLAGPLTNFIIAAGIAIGVLLLVASVGVPVRDPVTILMLYMLGYGLTLNAMLGAFNMIPIQPFDGATVKMWNTAVWAALTVALAALLLFGFFIVPQFSLPVYG
jgi:Zn-dependent protease